MKTAILPILTVIFMGLSYIFNTDIGTEDQNLIIDSVTAILGSFVAIWGIWKNHKKGE